MSTYKNILVPTDFSDTAAHVAARACSLAAVFGAKVSIVHVIDYVPPLYISVNLPEELNSADDLIERARAALADWVKDHGLKVDEQIVTTGSPKNEISEVAKKRGVDLIIIGTSGERAMHLLLGSTTRAVLHHSPCDVLSVHP